MASLSTATLLKISSIGQLFRNFHQSPVFHLNRKWREDNGLTVNPNSFGPLTNLPDYSFEDGRPVPYGSNQKRRIDEQRENLEKIKHLSDEVDYAVERHAKMVKEMEEYKKQIQERKLKRKGDRALLELTIDEVPPLKEQPS